MKDLISIIVPIYNVSKYLDKCIESIVEQTYKNIEIILVDDGSTDGSDEICKRFTTQDSRVRYFHKENGGLVSARKAGLEVARGKYVGFVDGDDYIENSMYERLLSLMISSDADFIHGGYMKNNESIIRGTGDSEIVDLKTESERISTINRLIFDLDKGQIMSPCLCFKLFKKDVICLSYSKVPYDQSYGEDLLALCDLLFKCNRIAITSEGYYHYVVRDESIMNSISRDKVFRENDLRSRLIELFCKYNLGKTEFDSIMGAINTYWFTGIIEDIKKIKPDMIRIFNCPFIKELRGKKIVLYGAGNVGEDYYSQIIAYNDVLIVDWIDKDYKRKNKDYYQVGSVYNVKQETFDYIVVAVLDKILANSIKQDIIDLGIDEGKILWEKPKLSSTML